ncbi:alpha/beta hydrolase [Roseitranquillus sediminis]|uniref:alpha/beta hydrolase n=1 Tax=Roseitranquillus sediminis TaxID=2809051 RepID=UPI001D0C0AE8|nr:alpha/beta fold hydrolase [Roseitranquillus sediminis]MBM9594459.1 alpha/beta fold hydrolase [Roseitranquillus sediminis]
MIVVAKSGEEKPMRRFKIKLCKATAACALLIAAPLVAGQAMAQNAADSTQAAAETTTAAAITYRETERPAALEDSFGAETAAVPTFFEIGTLDGSTVEAVLWEPPRGPAPDATLVLSVHGSGNSYAGNPIVFLAPGLAERGWPVLAINTRQSGEAVNTDNFFDIENDIEAAFHVARDMGYESIVLHGQSLGNIQVQFFAATHWDDAIDGVVLTGPFADLPWKSRHILVQDEQNFADLADAAFDALRSGRVDETLPVRMGWITGQQVPLTAQHFLTYRWGPTSSAVGTYWIKRVPVPVLLVRDQGDAIVRDFEPFMLLSEARSEGSLVPSIDYIPIENADGLSPAAHGFDTNRSELIEVVAGWLETQGL